MGSDWGSFIRMDRVYLTVRISDGVVAPTTYHWQDHNKVKGTTARSYHRRVYYIPLVRSIADSY